MTARESQSLAPLAEAISFFVLDSNSKGVKKEENSRIKGERE